MCEAQNIREVESLGVDWMGFIFYPASPRYCNERPAYLPLAARRVGVFVDATESEIMERVQQFGLQTVQLHGHESPRLCCHLRRRGVEVWKAIAVSSQEDLQQTTIYQGQCDALLFDSRSPLVGGSGRAFDWTLLAEYEGNTPFLLSGGLAPSSLEALCRFTHPQWMGIDLNSGFERAPGYKNVEALRCFLDELNKCGGDPLLLSQGM